MSELNPIIFTMMQAVQARAVGSEIAVNTQVLFPSNGIVTVYVGGGMEQCVVSDKGGAAHVVEGHGVRVPSVSRWLSGFARPFGLKVTNNAIHSGLVPTSELPGVVMLVANASAQAARFALDTYGVTSARDLTQEIEDRLVFEFGKPQVARNVELPGDSNRMYRFDFQVGGVGGSKIVIDHVGPFPSSINAKAVAHIDLGRRHDSRITQAMVYDPQLEWSSSDLIFLQSAAPTVPLEKMNDAIRRKTLN